MELDRTSRILELAVCLLWLLTFFLRVRNIQVNHVSGSPAEHLASALRPLRTGTLVVLALCVPLWSQAKWQPVAHALFVPSLVAGGIVQTLVAVTRRRRAA